MSSDGDTKALTTIKICCMVLFFLMICIIGSLPLRLKAFKTNKKLLSYSAAFAGGLFLSVGFLHILPEACNNFNDYYESIDENYEHFPFPFLISVLSFSIILFIEKIAIDTHSHGHAHEHEQVSPKKQVDNAIMPITTEQNTPPQQEMALIAYAPQLSAATKMTELEKTYNPLAPFILQIAVGIHAFFEGLSIGIQEDPIVCLGIALAVIFHKWAEGLTLGLAFKQAGTSLSLATYMIVLQGIFNPLGIAVGWILTSQGLLVTGIFLAISAGTFVYIATLEVLVEEFAMHRYKWVKFGIYGFSIGFVSCIFFLEQATGG